MNQDMIKLPDFKSQKRANLQGLEKFLGQKKRPDAAKHPGEKW
ncbi:MAG: hypothetical protein QUV08_14525 [Parasphingorhabdus sp.]|nr:hypothetical protein [Parasphingorhabdus sp.]